MKKINITFKNEDEKIEFVNICELDFEKRLLEATQKIVNSNVNCVLLSGPTCSGKTTTAKKLIDDFNEIGKTVIVISLDDFFKERDDGRVVTSNKKIDYDSVDVLDLDLLTNCIKNAYIGNTITVPIFNFLTQKRDGENKYFINESTVLLFEGIQAVYPEVTSLFDVEYKGIFINVNEDVCINGVFFSKNEIRLVRRLVRDRKFRGATADFTLYLWETVRENEEKSIYPNKDICEVQLDSFMCYELFLMKKYIIEVLAEIDADSQYYSEAKRLLDKFAKFEHINYEYIPKDSLYEEFLGKK
ncbi:MAG: Flp pilus assembly complex ATPase component TadA [Clostridia bacterium]|nr:Flp pilus assembly complex ATPase component TadA [Clostridia bacterium]